MTTRDFSGDEIIKVLVNVGNFEYKRTKGSHAQLVWENPHGGEDRHVTVPKHDSIAIGTLRQIADDAGADDFDAFCGWIDRNR